MSSELAWQSKETEKLIRKNDKLIGVTLPRRGIYLISAIAVLRSASCAYVEWRGHRTEIVSYLRSICGPRLVAGENQSLKRELSLHQQTQEEFAKKVPSPNAESLIVSHAAFGDV